MRIFFASGEIQKLDIKLPKKIEIFMEQLINSGVVAGIAYFSILIASPEAASPAVAMNAFGLTFLIELRKYRKIQ